MGAVVGRPFARRSPFGENTKVAAALRGEIIAEIATREAKGITRLSADSPLGRGLHTGAL